MHPLGPASLNQKNVVTSHALYMAPTSDSHQNQYLINERYYFSEIREETKYPGFTSTTYQLERSCQLIDEVTSIILKAPNWTHFESRQSRLR